MASVEARLTRRNGREVKVWDVRHRTPEGGQRRKTFRKKGDADRFAASVETDKSRGEWVDPARGRMTVGAFAETWMAGRAHLKPTTLVSYESLLRTQVAPTWGTVPLSRVTHADVTAWVAAMRADGLSASRTRQAYHLLLSMLDDAVKDNRLPRNPAAGVSLPRLPRTTRRYLTHEQVHVLADACGDRRILVLLLAYCGLRWGEAAALRVRRVDLLRRRLRIEEAVANVNGRVVFGSPKTHQHREVAVPRFLAGELAVVLAGRGPDDLVFTTSRGTPLRVQNFRRDVFDRAAAAVGLPGLVPHELRHTAASLAIASGASVKGVQAMLGHASAAMTLDLYGHLMGDELDGVAERIDAAARARVPAVPSVCHGGAVVPLTEREHRL
jgi:integrase